MNPNGMDIKDIPMNYQYADAPGWPEIDAFFAEGHAAMLGLVDVTGGQGQPLSSAPTPPTQPLLTQVPTPPAQPLPTQAPTPIKPARGGPSRRRCFPCHTHSSKCDYLDKVEAAQKAGQDIAKTPVCCTPCENRAKRFWGFEQGFCHMDDDASRAAGYQHFLDAKHAMK